MSNDRMFEKATGKVISTVSGGGSLAQLGAWILQPNVSVDPEITGAAGTGGITQIMMEVFNTSAATALADFEVGVQPHPDSAVYPLITGTAWASVAGVLRAKSASINTLAANTGAMVLFDVGPAYGFLVKAKSAGTTLLNNGTFTGSATSWTLGSGWAYSSNNVAATAASTTLKQTRANMGTAWTAGLYYRVSFTISNYSAGSLSVGTNTDPAQLIGASDGSTSSSVAANGTYEALVLADGNANGLVFTGTGFTGTIDSISAIEGPILNIRWSGYR